MSSELAGTVTLITRAKDQARELQALIAKKGGKTALQPGIEILPPENWNDLDDALRALAKQEYDWAIFSSANGVRFTVDRARELGIDPFQNVKLAAVGSGTRDALASYGYDVDVVPAVFDADGVVDALVERLGASLPTRRFLSFRADRGRKTLRDRLTALGAPPREVAAYRSVDASAPDPEILEALREGKIDYATVMSSATAKALAKILAPVVNNARWIALSELTAGAARKEGIKIAAVAKEATIESLADAVVELHNSLKNNA